MVFAAVNAAKDTRPVMEAKCIVKDVKSEKWFKQNQKRMSELKEVERTKNREELLRKI